MPVGYLTQALRGLATAWRFPGQRSSPPSYDIGLPIQPVDDVGSFARSARIFYQPFQLPLFTAGPNTTAYSSIRVRDLFDVATTGSLARFLQRHGYEPGGTDVYLLGVFGGVTVASATWQAADWARHRWSNPDSLQFNFPQLLATSDTVEQVEQAPTHNPMVLSNTAMLGNERPARLDPNDELLVSVSTGAGATSALMGFHLAYAPAGMLPGTMGR